MISPWLSLHRMRGASRRAKKNALDAGGNDPKRAIRLLRDNGCRVDSRGDRQVLQQLREMDGWIVGFGELGFPPMLREIPDPPMCLFGVGNPQLLTNPAVAFVGTRRCTQYGRNACRTLVAGFHGSGAVIVSGLAAGVDSCAHQNALHLDIPTVAVLGTGIDICYPRHNRKLYDAIRQTGTLITEYDPGTPPSPSRFPVRNRIISGMSKGVVVVEARERSGSMITLRLALEQNREVFAVPGRAFDRASSSTNRAIQRGEAKLVISTTDIVEELSGFDISTKSATVVPESSGGILDLLLESPRSIDELVLMTHSSREQILMEVTMLELTGSIERNGADRFRKR